MILAISSLLFPTDVSSSYPQSTSSKNKFFSLLMRLEWAIFIKKIFFIDVKKLVRLILDFIMNSRRENKLFCSIGVASFSKLNLKNFSC
jgi:hypothetical protein